MKEEQDVKEEYDAKEEDLKQEEDGVRYLLGRDPNAGMRSPTMTTMKM